jgi:hypothetical protein
VAQWERTVPDRPPASAAFERPTEPSEIAAIIAFPAPAQ